MISVLSFLLLISACAAQPTEVKVPVPVPCEARWPVKPLDQVNKANNTTAYTRGLAVLKDLEAYREYSQLLEIVVQQCSTNRTR